MQTQLEVCRRADQCWSAWIFMHTCSCTVCSLFECAGITVGWRHHYNRRHTRWLEFGLLGLIALTSHSPTTGRMCDVYILGNFASRVQGKILLNGTAISRRTQPVCPCCVISGLESHTDVCFSDFLWCIMFVSCTPPSQLCVCGNRSGVCLWHWGWSIRLGSVWPFDPPQLIWKCARELLLTQSHSLVPCWCHSRDALLALLSSSQ